MRHIIYLLITFIYSSAGAMTPLSGIQLQKALSSYQKADKRVAKFRQTRTLKRWNTSIKTQGILRFEKNPQPLVIWEITSPEYSALRLSSEGLSVKSKKSDKAWKTIDNPQFKKQMAPLFSWLSFDSDKIGELYTVYLEKSDQFKLVPKDDKSPLESIHIKGSRGEVKEVTLHEKTKDQINIFFTAIEPKK